MHSLAAAAIAASLALAGCGTSETEEAATPSTSIEATTEAMETSMPAEEPTTEKPAETPVEEIPTEEAPAAAPESTRDPVVTGPLEGEELNAAGVAWFDAYCSGVMEASLYTPDTAGMSPDELKEAAADTYAKMSDHFAALAGELGSLDASFNFENSEGFATNATDIVTEISSVYADGSATVQAGDYASEAELVTVVTEVEENAVRAGGNGFGVTDLDDSVLEAVSTQVVACSGE